MTNTETNLKNRYDKYRYKFSKADMTNTDTNTKNRYMTITDLQCNVYNVPSSPLPLPLPLRLPLPLPLPLHLRLQYG